MLEVNASERRERSRPRPGLRAGLRIPLLFAVLFVGAGGAAPESRPAPGQLLDDAGDLKITLERIIDENSLNRKKGRWSKWLTGRSTAVGFGRPYGLAWDGDALVVTDPGAAQVLRIDRKDRIITSPVGAFSSPIGVAICDGGIVVTDSGSGEVTILDGSLEPVRSLATGLARPTGVACSADRVFVVETGRHRILVFDPTKTSAPPIATFGTRGAGPGEFNFPTALFLSHGVLWVGDTMNFRIQKLDAAEGEPRGMFGQLGDASGEMPRIKGIARDRGGHIWVSDAYLDEIAVYRSDGTYLRQFGAPGRDPGRFSFPAGIAAGSDGRIAVVDSLNRRVQVFKVVEVDSEREP